MYAFQVYMSKSTFYTTNNSKQQLKGNPYKRDNIWTVTT